MNACNKLKYSVEENIFKLENLELKNFESIFYEVKLGPDGPYISERKHWRTNHKPRFSGVV